MKKIIQFNHEKATEKKNAQLKQIRSNVIAIDWISGYFAFQPKEKMAGNYQI